MIALTQPEEGEEKEDLASVESTSDLTDKLIIPSDLGGNLACFIRAGFGWEPEVGRTDGIEGSYRVDAPNRCK